MRIRRHRWHIESFRLSIIIHYLLLVILPFLILLTIFLLYSWWSTANTFADNALKLLQAEQRQLTDVYKTSVQNSMFPYYRDFVDRLQGALDHLETQEEMRAMMIQEMSIRQNMDAILLQADGQWLIAGRNYDGVINRLVGYNAALEEAGGRPLWITAFAAFPKNRSGYKLVLGRSINAVGKADVAKLYLLIDMDVFSPVFDMHALNGGGCWLLNDDGVVLGASDKQRIGQIQHHAALGVQGNEGWRMVSIDGRMCLSAYVRSQRTGWTLVRATPMSAVLRGLEVVHWGAFIVGLVYMTFLWVMLAQLNQLILRPTEQLAACMDKVAGGNLLIRANGDIPGEIGKLNRHFNGMIHHMVTLMQKNEETEREKNNFKIKALVAQLNPHFLYNALNTIKWMAVITRQTSIQGMVESLIRILMNAARTGTDYYTLGEEMNLIQDYAVIQKARFMNFRIETSVSEEAAACPIRRFLVQPVVENAIIHGFGRGQHQNGMVTIRAWTDQALHIHVSDNGCGFDVSSISPAGPSADDHQEHLSMALSSIQQIIAMEYGEPYGIQIMSRPGAGTTVAYALPVLESGSNHGNKEVTP